MAEIRGNRIFGDEAEKGNRIPVDHVEYRFRIAGKYAMQKMPTNFRSGSALLSKHRCIAIYRWNVLCHTLAISHAILRMASIAV